MFGCEFGVICMAVERAKREAADKQRLMALPQAEFLREVAYRNMRAQEDIARKETKVIVNTSIF